MKHARYNSMAGIASSMARRTANENNIQAATSGTSAILSWKAPYPSLYIMFKMCICIHICEQRMIFVTWGNWRGVPTSFSSPVWFLKAWPRTPLPYRVWMPYFFLTGWLVAGCSWLWLAGLGWLGWLAAGCVADWLVPGWWLAGRRAGWLAGLAGWLAWLAGCWLAGWLAVYILLYMIMDGWYLMDVGSRFYWHESDLVLTSFWPRTGPRTCTAPEFALIVLIISPKKDEDKVPTSY